MNKTKNQIKEAIAAAIESISDDITRASNSVENKSRAEAIKALAEAYDIIHRGKVGDF